MDALRVEINALLAIKMRSGEAEYSPAGRASTPLSKASWRGPRSMPTTRNRKAKLPHSMLSLMRTVLAVSQEKGLKKENNTMEWIELDGSRGEGGGPDSADGL